LTRQVIWQGCLILKVVIRIEEKQNHREGDFSISLFESNLHRYTLFCILQMQLIHLKSSDTKNQSMIQLPFCELHGIGNAEMTQRVFVS
jgi:hypothetical protein